MGSQCQQSGIKFYSVVRGEPFMYSGKVPNSDIHSVDVKIVQTAWYAPIETFSVPVNPDRTFTFRVDGNKTEEWGEEYYYFQKNSHSRVYLNYSTAQEWFYLVIVPEANDIRFIKNSTYLCINPVNDKYVRPGESLYTGDLIINGTTNLPAGETISLGIYSNCMLPCQKKCVEYTVSCCGCGYDGDIIKVQNGSNGINIWTVTVNTSLNKFYFRKDGGNLRDYMDNDNTYNIFVKSVNTSQENINCWDSTLFTIRER
jgi:hypothetical protein